MKIPGSLLLQTGLPAEYVVKELKIQEALAGLSAGFADAGLQYAFFGGTALNQFHLKAKRFSEDLDFFAYGSAPGRFTAFLKKSLPAFASTGPSRIFGEFHRWKLAYSDEENGVSRDFLFVDANFAFHTPPTPLSRLEPRSFLNDYGFFVRTPPMYSFPPEVFAAQKMVAISARTAGRDYYDLSRLLTEYRFSRRQLLPHARVYSKPLFGFMPFDERTFFASVAAKAALADPRELAAADAFIPAPHRPNWLQLKKELVQRIRGLK
ncbi:MAG: nucleotidyl transferase AbiEii/AbiGii toxin family protein [Candidatus Micrarchaeota archaeon]